MRLSMSISFLLAAIALRLSGVRCSGCYFPLEYVGTYLLQSEGSSAFSEVTLEPDALVPWGSCHRRRGSNVILKDTTGGEDCMRCFHLTMKSPNVIQIHTEGLGKCYTREEAVRATCPDDRAVHERKFKEIMLYRKQENAEPVFCPMSGKFRFTYTAADGRFRCDQTLSDLANCPRGNVLGVRFRQCSFPDMDVSFRCLGDWSASGQDRYLALMDLRGGEDGSPRFRCGMYRVDPLTGRVLVSLSMDSTCHNRLRSATDGYESLILTPFPERSPPDAVLRGGRCRFPGWAQGAWESVSREVLQLRDRPLLRRVALTCLAPAPNDRFLVFASTHCGEESYNCVWIKRRSANVMEFQIGSQPSEEYSDSLCHDLQFRDDGWITQGRPKGTASSGSGVPSAACPITGDYGGELPEAGGLCAKIASDCNNPDLLFYTVSNCSDRGQVFEEREYRCLGSWTEDGITYTYTQRRDMDGYQCFSGKVSGDGREAYIKEAGHSCVRGEDPLLYGMKITMHSACPDSLASQGPRWPTVAPPDLYSPLPNDPFWYQNDPHDPRNRKSQTRATREETPNDISHGYRSSLSTAVLMVTLFLFFMS